MSSLNSGSALLFGTSSFLNSSSAGSFRGSAGKEEEEDEDNINNELREREVSSVGGTPTRSALKQAKRDRRQKAKDGDAELAFAGGSDAWGSVEDEGLKEIVVVPTDDNARHCALPSRHHQRQHSIQSDFGSKFVALMGGRNKEEESQSSTFRAVATNNDDKPPPRSKRDNLRRGKRDLMSGWCQDLDNQKHEGHIMNWVEDDLIGPNSNSDNNNKSQSGLSLLAEVAKGGMALPPPSPQSPSLSLSLLRSSTSMVVSSLRKLVETSRVMEEEDFFVGNDDVNNCVPRRDPFSSSGTTTTPSVSQLSVIAGQLSSPVDAVVGTTAAKGPPHKDYADHGEDECNNNNSTSSSSNLLLLVFDDVNYQTLELQPRHHPHHPSGTNVDEEVAVDSVDDNGDSGETTIRDHADVSLRLPNLATQPSLLPGGGEYHHQYEHNLVGRAAGSTVATAGPSSSEGNRNTITRHDEIVSCCMNDNNRPHQLGRSAASSSMISLCSDQSNDDIEASLVSSSQQHQRSTTKSSYRQLLKMMNDSTTFAKNNTCNQQQPPSSPDNASLGKGVMMRRDEEKDVDDAVPSSSPLFDGGSGSVSATSRVWGETRRGEPTTCIIESLGVIHTQPILRTTDRSRPRPPSTVTINECVYNLNNWDEEELGWFVIPTDNIDEVPSRGGNNDNYYSDSYVSGECKAATSLSSTDIDGTPLTHDEPSTTSPMIPLSTTTTDWHNIIVTSSTEAQEEGSGGGDVVVVGSLVRGRCGGIIPANTNTTPTKYSNNNSPSLPRGGAPLQLPRLGSGGNTTTNQTTQHQYHPPQSISSLPSMLMSSSSSTPYPHPSPPLNHGNAVDVLSAFFTKNSNNNDNTTFPSSMLSSMSASFATTPQLGLVASLSSAVTGGDSTSSFYRRVTVAPNTSNMHTKEEEDEMRSTTSATAAAPRQLPDVTVALDHNQHHHHNQFKALLAQLQRPGGIRGPIRLGCDDKHQTGITTTSKDNTQSTTSTVVPPSALQPLFRDDHMDVPHISSPATLSGATTPSARFTDVISRYNVIVDTLTHGAANHTLQLAHPISGINAKAYQRREAQMMAKDRQQQHDEDDGEDVNKEPSQQ